MLSFRPMERTDAPSEAFHLGDRIMGIAVETAAPPRRLVGVGGVFHVPHPSGIIGGDLERGYPVVFFNVYDEAYRSPFLVHRLGRGVVQAAQRQWGRVFATCDMRQPRALPWLESLGFRVTQSSELDAGLLALQEELGRLWVAERGAT